MSDNKDLTHDVNTQNLCSTPRAQTGTLPEKVYESESDYHDYVDSPPLPPPEQVAKASKVLNLDGSSTSILKARKSAFIERILYLDGAPFSFEGRGYLRQIYDSRDRKILLKTARQVEKCHSASTQITLSDGRTRTFKDLNVGDFVCSLDTTTLKMCSAKVIEKYINGFKKVFRVRTRKKREVIVTGNHPFKTILGWSDCSDLKKGSFVALPQQAGLFGRLSEPDAAFILGALLGDGCTSVTRNSGWFGLTQIPGELSEEFCEKVASFSGETVKGLWPDKRSGSMRYPVGKIQPVFDYLEESEACGKKAADKIIPERAFSYDEESTRQLLRGLWGTDGHCKNVTKSKIDLVYSTVSKRLVEDVQRLLLKFGVFSSIRENKPTLYKGTDKVAYILRVQGRRSFENFYNKIGPIPGKPFVLPTCAENNNTNKIPIEVNELLEKKRREYKVRLKEEGKRFQGENSWQKAGLRIDRQYSGYSYPKFKKFCEFFNDDELWNIYNSDIFWDEVESIEELPPEPTFGIEVEGHHNHITDGIITHNTTMLGNNMTIKSVVLPYHKSLYVSPSHAQTRQFSNEKLKPVLEKSPFVKKYFQDTSVSTQVFEKGFTNGSFIFMRSCFRTADRARGISANDLYLDEIQDLLISEIPVIAECTSHFDDYFHLFAGTPKTFDNPIEYFWKDSTQNEWMVKCGACNHWNFLDEGNIAPTDLYNSRTLAPGPVCKKCMKHINVAGGKWMTFNPAGSRQGYRIPQLMVPWITGTYDQWDKLLWKRDNYPTGQFYNEVLGLSFDSANKPITQDELLSCCDPERSFIPYPFTVTDISRLGQQPLAAGVDWGEGNDGAGRTPSGKLRVASYTVLTIGYYATPDNFQVVYSKKYTGREVDPNFVITDIAGIVKTLNVRLVGVDWGHGWGMNNMLRRQLGSERVMIFQHLPRQKENMKWDPIGLKFQLKRNFWVSELFVALKSGKIRFPKWREFEPFARDILAVYTEFSEYTREMRYDHRSSDPDDFMHSLIYCKLAGDTLIGRRQW